MSAKHTVLIISASTGIGAYAVRFARHGRDLVLVARDFSRLEYLADRLRHETSVAVDVLQSDLTNEHDLTRVENRLPRDRQCFRTSCGPILLSVAARRPDRRSEQSSR